jgi:hypothetical protein
MRTISRLTSRPAAAAVTVGGAAVLLLARPLRGQQPAPAPLAPEAIHVTVPAAAAAGPTTDVSYRFALPAPLALQGHPRVRVLDRRGRLIELLLMYIDSRSPVWSGHRGLHTENYRSGSYAVTVEVDYLQGDGTKATVATPAATVTVAAR